MGNTADRYREVDARRKGYYAGLFDEPRRLNPYKPVTGTNTAWRDGWESGRQERRRRQSKGIAV